MTTQTLSPVRKSVTVNASQERAFDFFTQSFGDWWPLDGYSIGEGSTRAVLEPREGGRWYETGGTGDCQWGHVIAFEPPERLLLAWKIDGTWQYNPDFQSEVEIRFVPEGDGTTRVELEHRDMDRFGDAVRAEFDGPNGWTGLLRAYAEKAAA